MAPPDKEEEWKTVTSRRFSRRGNHAHNQQPKGSSLSTSAEGTHTPWAGSKTVDELAREFDEFSTRWRASDGCEWVRKLVAKGFKMWEAGPGDEEVDRLAKVDRGEDVGGRCHGGKKNVAKMTISNAVCLGHGTFDPERAGWEAKRMSLVQFLAFETMVEQLELLTGTKIPTVIQEPLLTSAEVSFLETSRGHTVVRSPVAFGMVNSETFFFGIHLYHPIYKAVLSFDRGLPVIFVGTGWGTWEEIGAVDDSASRYTYSAAPSTQPALRLTTTASGATSTLVSAPTSKERDELKTSRKRKKLPAEDPSSSGEILEPDGRHPSQPAPDSQMWDKDFSALRAMDRTYWSELFAPAAGQEDARRTFASTVVYWRRPRDGGAR